jgi:hypothetical protein
MKTPRAIIALAIGFGVVTSAQAGDVNLSQLLSTAVATLPAAAETSPLQSATEVAMHRQIAEIDARMTRALAAPAAAPTTTELALSAR